MNIDFTPEEQAALLELLHWRLQECGKRQPPIAAEIIASLKIKLRSIYSQVKMERLESCILCGATCTVDKCLYPKGCHNDLQNLPPANPTA